MEAFDTTPDGIVKAVTIGTIALLLVVAISEFMQFVRSPGWLAAIGFVAPAAIVLFSYLFSVQRYVVDAHSIGIVRVVGTIRIPTADTLIYRDDKAADGAVRVWANGGLFSVVGVFYKRGVGFLHLYARNRKAIVVIKHNQKTFLVSPDDSDRFLAATKRNL